jgi:pimeloyl-ACP methyl ester carboxylesterase
MLLFQFEGTAETLLMRDDWALFRAWSRGPLDVARYIEDLSRPGALTAALNWYRANVAPASQLQGNPPLPSVSAPTLGIWSDGDAFLIEEGMVQSASFVTGPFRYERIAGTNHWVPNEAPDQLNALLLPFLKALS